MLYEIQKTKEIYRLESDKSLLNIAEENFGSLRSEIIPVLLEELKKRKIGEDIINKYESTFNILDDHRIMQWIDKITQSKCPDCNQKGHGLVCYTGRNTVSFITRSVYLNRIFISCTYCRSEKLRKLNFETMVLGWWSFSGFFRTIYSITKNLHNNNLSDKKNLENIYRYVILHHEFLEEDEDNLTEMLDKINKA